MAEASVGHFGQQARQAWGESKSECELCCSDRAGRRDGRQGSFGTLDRVFSNTRDQVIVHSTPIATPPASCDNLLDNGTGKQVKARRSHGTGEFDVDALASCGADCVFEAGVRIFHPENVHLGDNVYVGHDAILKGYYRGELRIGDGTWIGQQCFFHAGGSIRIGSNVGIGPGVKILTSQHSEAGRGTPILHAPVEFAPVVIDDDADLGVGCIVMPGVTIGRGAQVGAGAVVTGDVPPYAVVAGVPAKVLRFRPDDTGSDEDE